MIKYHEIVRLPPCFDENTAAMPDFHQISRTHAPFPEWNADSSDMPTLSKPSPISRS
jgi:hypothetical protein